jgi:hypothetical protein
VAHILAAEPPVVAPRWKLAAHGLTPADIIVARERHVMAVGPGENGFLVALETFLGDRSDTIEARLRELAVADGEESQ